MKYTKEQRQVFEAIKETQRRANLYPELLKRAQLQGGGDTFLEHYGRYCFCPAMGAGENHSSGCDDLNKAILADKDL